MFNIRSNTLYVKEYGLHSSVAHVSPNDPPKWNTPVSCMASNMHIAEEVRLVLIQRLHYQTFYRAEYSY